MNSVFVKRIAAELEEIKASGLFKTERIIASAQGAEIFVGGATVLNFCANNYLGLSSHPGVIEAAHSDYVRTAWAKGLRMPRVVLKHILRNAMIPVVALAAVQFGYMLGGSIVIDGIYIGSIGLGDLRSKLAIIPQNPGRQHFRFPGIPSFLLPKNGITATRWSSLSPSAGIRPRRRSRPTSRSSRRR